MIDLLKQSESVSVFDYDFPVIASTFNMISISKNREIAKKDSHQNQKKENERFFIQTATFFVSNFINIMRHISAKLDFTSDQWYILFLAENCLRANIDLYDEIVEFMGRIQSENDLTVKEIERFKNYEDERKKGWKNK